MRTTVLLTKLAKVHGWTNAETHNRLLRRYGNRAGLWTNLIAVYLPDTDKTENRSFKQDRVSLDAAS